MADLELWKKYPAEGQEGEDSYRLDHPSFQNVQRVNYAKGVITDFKRVDEGDEASGATSMVKVDIEGYGESDYIPLFYHPKAQYWDTSWVKAQDFDETQKCFTRAYWSFRCDDEVVVLMQASSPGAKLEPVAVVGFEDNFPRIGENIAKIIGDEVKEGCQFFRADTNFPAASLSDEKGPDGLALQLLTKAEQIKVYEGNLPYYEQTFCEQIGGRWYTSCYFTWKGSGWWCLFTKINTYITIHWCTHSTGQYTRHVNHYIFCIGPYVYVLRIIVKWQTLELNRYFEERGPYQEELYDIMGICSLMPEWQADNQAQCVWDYPDPPEPYSEMDDDYTPVISTLFIRALYNEENYEKAKNWKYIPTGTWSEPTEIPDGFVKISFVSFVDNPEKNQYPQFELYVRPHTKEELIEAGLYDGSP